MSPSTPVSALTIAGSDSGGGAGIQADLKAFAAHRVHGLSAIAALTAQHTRGVTAVHVPPLPFLQAQLDACFDDFDIHAVKLGMLANADVIHLVADVLEQRCPTHIVLDPVMVATSGAKLLEYSALRAMRERLLPLATLLTPNTPEAELLLGRRIGNGDEAEDAAAALIEMGAGAVLLKGGHLLRGRPVPMHRLTLSGLIIGGFLAGGILGAWLFTRWQYDALLVPAVLTGLSGLGYVLYRQWTLRRQA